MCVFSVAFRSFQVTDLKDGSVEPVKRLVILTARYIATLQAIFSADIFSHHHIPQ